MSGLTNDQTNLLRHGPDNRIKNWKDIILQQIWYSSSRQAYIQRNSSLDDTLFCKDTILYNPLVDSLTLALLFKVFHLRGILHVTDEKANALENVLLREYDKKESILLLGNPKHKISVFHAFDEKLRNAFAHGTFNVLEDGTALFVGQAKSKQESPLNFYFRIRAIDYITEWHKTFDTMPTQLKELENKVYSLFYTLKIALQPGLYTREDASFVYFDNEFRFRKIIDGADSQDEQLRQHIMHQGIDCITNGNNRVFYILTETSNSKFEKTQLAYSNVQVISGNKMLEHLGVNVIR